MKLLGNRKSKKQKLSLKYNIQKRIREHKRRVKKEAKKLGLKKRIRKDPGIPNSLPWKGELLAEIEVKKAKKEEELAKKKQEVKEKNKLDRQQQRKDAEEMQRKKESERRKKRAEDVLMAQLEALQRMLQKADILLITLDARDPLHCRCAELEAWVKQNQKRLIFVLTKVDLIVPQQAADWQHALGQVGPAACVQVEAGGEGVKELLHMLGARKSSEGEGPTVGVLGYEGTGKKSLLKALRREAAGATSPQLVESVGRLRPAEDPEGEEALNATLHLAMRGLLSKREAGPEPLEVVRHLVARCGPQALMRRYRLPAFDGPEGLVQAWAKAFNVKTKKGKVPGVEAAAQLFLQQLATSPCCSCLPPGQLEGGGLWEGHERKDLEPVMKAQLDLLRGREASGARGLTWPSHGLGPSIALQELMDHVEDESDDGMDDGFEEGEEEEWMEGEGEEEEDLEDDAMED
ncbi:unnamed protein product [Durusdinium trenchii]|uniref:Guanine nucleotide-binding protein-like 3 N-terminal domain-containing protein n=1 Tax=Durusdinium trenchii TaxID=1381693 RepID=A0ABP0LDC1_9DINO